MAKSIDEEFLADFKYRKDTLSDYQIILILKSYLKDLVHGFFSFISGTLTYNIWVSNGGNA